MLLLLPIFRKDGHHGWEALRHQSIHVQCCCKHCGQCFLLKAFISVLIHYVRRSQRQCVCTQCTSRTFHLPPYNSLTTFSCCLILWPFLRCLAFKLLTFCRFISSLWLLIVSGQLRYFFISSRKWSHFKSTFLH